MHKLAPVENQEPASPSSGDLTPQERTFLDMNARGLTQRKIAVVLGVGVRRVARIAKKLRERGHTVRSASADNRNRPYQVAAMLTAGMTIQDIALQLRITPSTVRGLQRKARKMGLSVPPLQEKRFHDQTLENVSREIRKIRAPEIRFVGNVFEDVVLKQR